MILTDTLIAAIQLAEETATNYRHRYITTEHLVYALCEDVEVEKLLRKEQINRMRLRRRIREIIKKSQKPLPESVSPIKTQHTVHFKEAIREAWQRHAAMCETQSIRPPLPLTCTDLLFFLVGTGISSSQEILISEGLKVTSLLRDYRKDAENYAIQNDFPGSFLFGNTQHFVDPDDEYDSFRNIHDGLGTADENRITRGLSLYCKELVAQACETPFDPLIGRDNEVTRIIQVLCRRRKNNPVLVGEAGVGKTAVVNGLAQWIADGKVPPILANATIYSLDVGALIAGTRYRGQMEERIKSVMEGVMQIEGAILFIDEFHTIVGAGSASNTSLDISNMLKPALSAGTLRCIGATTFSDYRRYIQNDNALNRRFQKVEVLEPSIEETIEIIKGLKDTYENHHKVVYTDAAIEVAVNLSDVHLHEIANPDKTIDVIDEAGAMFSAYPDRFASNVIDAEQVRTVISKIARIPDINHMVDDATLIRNLDSKLKSTVFGQDQAIETVVNAVKMSRAGLKSINRPIASLLFAGPTGVGKTELAKQLAAELHIEFIRFDMSEYQEKHSISRLIGSPPGYIGHERGGLLTESIRKHPHSVLLLDEIEKADPDIFQILLQVMDAARLTDNSGYVANFRNVILILTTNAGSREFDRIRPGFDQVATKNVWNMAEIKTAFTPEFRNRLDGIVTFQPLTTEIVSLVVDKFMKDLEFQLSDRHIKISLSAAARAYLAAEGYDEKLGARPLDRIIQAKIKIPLSNEILFGELTNGGTVNIDLHNMNIVFNYHQLKKAN